MNDYNNNTKDVNNNEKFNSYIIFTAIFIAVVFVFLAALPSIKTGEKELDEKDLVSLDNIKPVSSKDHIRGDINAPVKIIEFSDFECPFCKKFHPTMQRVIDEYGRDGRVAWVYRHFPLDEIHPFKARNEAAATECAAELGGNDKFWDFADRIFEITPSNNKLDQALLPEIAEYIGLDRFEFESCLSSGRYDLHIEEDLQDAIATGGTGTPWSILIDSRGNKYPISGAQPYSAVKSIIDMALK